MTAVGIFATGLVAIIVIGVGAAAIFDAINRRLQ